MKDDGFLAFLAIVGLIAAIFFVEPADFTPRSPGDFSSPGVTTRSGTAQTSSNGISDIEKQIDEAEKRAEELKEEISELEQSQNRSDYYGLVKIERMRTSSDVDAEYIRLSASRNASESINITGWKLISLFSNNQTTIPQGTNLYRPNGQSVVGNIILNPRDTVYISSGKSPISESFRINKCSGYHEQFLDFSPRLRLQCPYPEEDLDIPFSIHTTECHEYVDRLPRCKIHTTEPPLEVNDDCREYIYQKISYPACVDFHKNDKDFYKAEWRLFLERRNPLWSRKYEVIQLIDNEGKIVDTYGD